MLHRLIIIALLLPVPGFAEPLQIFVSVLPQKTFVEKVGGEHVEVRVMVQPGHSPATYDPTPRQISALSSTDLYIRTGVPFENAWMKRIMSTNPDMQLLDVRDGIDLHPHKAVASTAGGHQHSHADHDPHIWTSPLLVKQMAQSIHRQLSVMDPANSRDYASNYAHFSKELDALDQELSRLFENHQQAKFMVFHPSWGYFAERYGLIQVAIEKAGKEPGARALTALINQAKKEKVKVIFVQPQFSKKMARQVATVINGRVVAIDPLSKDYANNLRKVAKMITGAIQE